MWLIRTIIFVFLLLDALELPCVHTVKKKLNKKKREKYT